MTETHHVAASAIGRLSMLPPAIWIVSGFAHGRRDHVARSLIASFDRAAHINGDGLAMAIVSGRVLPGEDPQAESERQVELSIRNQCLLARSYAEAGFTPVIEYAVLTRLQLDAYRHYLAGGRLRLVVAIGDDEESEPANLLRDELGELGLWVAALDAAAIVAAEGAASID